MTTLGPRVAGPDRFYDSAPLKPPVLAGDARIRSVHWRHELPPGRKLIAQLCTSRRCIGLDGSRGTSDALAGEPADVPLWFRFRLPAGERTPVQVGAIQLLVDYQ